MNKADYAGTGKVFRFSLQQYFKSAATYVMLALMLLGSGASVLLMTSSMDRGAAIDSEAERVYIRNESPFALDPAALPEYLQGELTELSLEDLLQRLDDGETTGVAVDVSRDGASGLWQVTAYTGEQTAVTQSEAADIAAACAAQLEMGRYAEAGVSPLQIAVALAPVSTDVLTEAEFRSPGEDDGEAIQTRTAAGSAYTILVFMLISFSTSFIVRAVVQEKTSRLVELLMVSVKPLALIAGKILAAMCLVAVGVLCAGLGLALSRTVLGLLGRDGGSAALGLGSILGNLNLGTGLAALVSILLGYLSFSILAALSGAGSPGISESESASGAAMLLNFLGYGIGMGTAFVGAGTGITVMSLVPFVSTYVAPYRFMAGDIGFPLLLLSWVLQALVSLLLMRGCAAVYGALLIHRGERIGLGKILKMIRGGAGA